MDFFGPELGRQAGGRLDHLPTSERVRDDADLRTLLGKRAQVRRLLVRELSRVARRGQVLVGEERADHQELLADDEAHVAQRCGAAHVAQHSDDIDGALRCAQRRGELPETARRPVVADRVRAPAVALLERFVAGEPAVEVAGLLAAAEEALHVERHLALALALGPQLDKLATHRQAATPARRR